MLQSTGSRLLGFSRDSLWALELGLSSCGHGLSSVACGLFRTRDQIPGPALAGRFPPTGPPEKSWLHLWTWTRHRLTGSLRVEAGTLKKGWLWRGSGFLFMTCGRPSLGLDLFKCPGNVCHIAWFPVATATNYHKSGGFRHQTFHSLTVWRPEVWNQDNHSPLLPPGALGKNPSPPIPASSGVSIL